MSADNMPSPHHQFSKLEDLGIDREVAATTGRLVVSLDSSKVIGLVYVFKAPGGGLGHALDLPSNINRKQFCEAIGANLLREAGML